ncbi:protein mono-ADP-ribosyltransferase PARP14-like isoform X2 [Mastacembelus armatus]|nr:protein mono-ADP-ribosyltransferase PARP14-like isoform X2 [Mastacembelus armatus]
MPISKELPIVEKKFKLVEEEFNREIRAQYQDVKILVRNTMITLEGPDKDVQSVTTKLDDLIKNVKEKRVKINSDLIAFIRSSDAISKFQNRFQQSLRNPVALEVGSDLVLSSLSSEALDEALAAVQRDLTVETVQLQGAAAVPSDLNKVKEILNKAKNEANCREIRVDVSFNPGSSGSTVTNVQFVGYSENVKKLKAILHDYEMNHVRTEENLNLSPELVDCFDKVLELTRMKETSVTLQASHYPHPCVSISGPRCLVQKVKADLSTKLASLISDKIVLDGPGVQQYFQGDGKVGKELVESSCHVIVMDQQSVPSPNVRAKLQRLSCLRSFSSLRSITRSSSISNTTGTTAVNKIHLEIKLGGLENEQVNALVAPMLNTNLTSTNIGKFLLSKAGTSLKTKFDLEAAKRALTHGALIPGDILQVNGPPSLGCSKLFFIECLPWDGVRGQSVQSLGEGLRGCLDLCKQQGLCSVAFPVIGPGPVLMYPLREAVDVLTESIRQFGLSRSSGSLTTIHVVIKPGYPDSEECYHDVYGNLSLNMSQGGQVIFRSLTSDLDNITLTVGHGVKLQLIFGDITNEMTDAIVNTTNFVHFDKDGVCKDILIIAGPEVEAVLKAAKVKRGEVFFSQPGLFPCKQILHVSGKKDAGNIEQLVCRIIEHCESSGYKSVAIPAICAGLGGMDPGVVASAILRGVRTATSSTPLYCLTDIHLVLIKINVFLAFKEEAMQVFTTPAVNRVSLPHLPPVQQQQPPSSLKVDLSMLQTSSASQQSVFKILGLDRNSVNDAKAKLKDLYMGQCSTLTFTKEQMEAISEDDMKNLQQLVETSGLNMQRDQSVQGGLTVSGFKDGVNKVMQLINASLHEFLRREVRDREEDNLYTCVAWCIMGTNGTWERLPKTANYKIENDDVTGGIVDAHGVMWEVDQQRMEATRRGVGQKATLKKLVHLPDFTLPLYWDNMAADETMKVVALQASSAEYRTVKEAFKRTVTKTVLKIERLQNVHLRRAYEAQKKHIADKNTAQGGAGETILYHGMTEDNCKSIMKTGFNRSFAGQNATTYGRGTYFAVDASYSAHPTYSKPAADGSQLMFVARVLTGIYTVGRSDMRVPPPRNNQQPDDRYDSLVDNINNPRMYVVFHDSQAYPDYLITFK